MANISDIDVQPDPSDVRPDHTPENPPDPPVPTQSGRNQPPGAWLAEHPVAAARPTRTSDLTAEFRVPREWRAPRQRRGAESTEPFRSAYAPVPLPPTDSEKYAYRKRRLLPLMLASFVSFGCLLVSQALFIKTTPALRAFIPIVVFTLVYYVISVIVNAGTSGFDMRAHLRLVRGWRPAEYPTVDVFLPVCGEPIHVLGNTWEQVRLMAGEYPGEVTVHVLDDSAEETLRRIADGFGFVYHRRPNRGWFKKAGNMRHAYERTSGDFILVLDADFAPRVDMLVDMLPYFDAEPDLGILQTPQYFRIHRGQGWVERGAGAVQELFYRSVQVSRQRHDSAICVGSCAVYRRAALDAIGGSTLIEHSEDVHTGFDLRVEGWRLRYIPVVLAAGLCPAEVNSFYTQQYRWCAGSMSLMRSRKFWGLKMSLRARLSYISGFCYYLHTALFTFVTPLIPLTLVWAMPRQIALVNYALILPSVLYTLVIFPMWHRCAFRLDAFTVKMIYGWAHAFAVWDLVRGRQMGWQPTGGTSKKSKTRRLWIGMWGWTFGTAALWVGGAVWRILESNPFAYLPIFLTGVFYLAIALQALLVDPSKDVSEVVP